MHGGGPRPGRTVHDGPENGVVEVPRSAGSSWKVSVLGHTHDRSGAIRRLGRMTAASTPELETDRLNLIGLIKAEAVFHGDFTLSSGKKATYYVDMRKLTLDHRAAPAIGRIMLDLIRDVDGIVAVGGLTLGADPIANAVMHESARTDEPLDAFVVRKEPKDHGRGRQVEGADVSGKRVVVVEDTSTTGSVGAEGGRGASPRGRRARRRRRDRRPEDRSAGRGRGGGPAVAGGDRPRRPRPRPAVGVRVSSGSGRVSSVGA